MKLERTFRKGKQESTLVLEVAKGKLTTVFTAGGKEKRREDDASSEAFRDYAALVKKQLKAGFDAVPLPDAPKAADALRGEKKLDVDLEDVLDAFTTEERAEIVEKEIARAEKAGKVVGPDAGYQRAGILAKAPTQLLLRHFLSSMLNGKLPYKYSSGGMNGDTFFFATAISNAARDPKNRGWVVAEVEKTVAVAEPVLKKWLQARIAKFRSQKKVAAQLVTAPGKPEKVEEDLLREIGAHPEDDGPREVWADWLLEHGNKWGEVVNLQCELARMTDSRVPRWKEVYEKAAELKTPNISKFLAPIRAFVSEYDVERGLLSRLTVSVEKLVKPGAAEAIVLRAPGARLELKGLKASHAKSLAKLPPGRFGELKIASRVPADALAPLLASPLLEGVRALELWSLDAKGVATLSKLPASVRELTLWKTPAGAAAGEAIAKSPAAKTLEDLSFPFSPALPVPAVEALKALPKLRSLALQVTPGAGAALARIPALATLSIPGEGFGDEDCLALAKGPALERLEIRAPGIGPAGATALLARGTGELYLVVEGSGIDFSKAKGVRSLTLKAPALGDAEAKALTSGPLAKSLQWLDISSESLGDAGAQALMTLSKLKGSSSLEGRFSATVSKQVKAFTT